MPDANPVPNEAVRAQLDRILLWQGFADSPQLGRFLRHVVEQKLSGNGAAIKEYSVGLEVFNRTTSFDPKSDSIVRSEARRLRSKLAEYYGAEGVGDPLRIDVPKGGYLPVFAVRNGAVTEAPAAEARGPAGRTVRRGRIAAWAGLASIALAAAYYLQTRKAKPPAVHVRHTVAVLGFDNLSGRPGDAWLSGAISGMLTTEFAADGALRTIPGEDVAHMQKDLGLGRMDALSRDTVERIRRYLDADFLVGGGYTVLTAAGNRGQTSMRLDLRVQSVRTGETIGAVAETGAQDDLFDLVSRAGAQLRQSLGAQPLSAADAGALRKAEPSTPEAKRLYYEGLGRMRDYDWARARDLLTKAVQSDPTFPLTHAALSAVWGELVYTQKCREEAKTAFDLSPNLPHEERLLVEAEFRGASGDWGGAERIYADLFHSFPDNVGYGLALAGAQERQQKLQAELASIETLRRLPHPPGDDPRIDLAEAAAYRALGKYREALPMFEKAEQKARSQGARGLLWHALHQKAEDLEALGQHPQARAASLEARQICAWLGDRICVARSLARLGMLDAATNLKEAERQFQASYEIAQREGSFYAANALSNLGAILQMEGEYARAERALGEAATAVEEAHDKPFLVRVTINRGNLLYGEGKLRAAEGMYRKAIAVVGEGDDKTWLPASLTDLAQVLELEGELAESMKCRQQVLALSRASRTSAASVLAEIAGLLCIRGDVGAARQTLDQAEAEAGKAGVSDFPAQSAAFAEVALAEGRAAVGETLARRAEERAKAENRPDGASEACEVLARCLLAEGRISDAQAGIGRAQSYLGARKAADSLFNISITGARVQAATAGYRDRANVNAAIRSLDAAIAEARRSRFAGVPLAARLARGEIRMRSGRVGEGRAELRALAKEAAAKGYGLLARKAAEESEAGEDAR
ncbi:MAG: tetratricopeptide repeat protein [Bryobacteraceae bacterium]